MNVASLTLCKELHELSGWDEPMSTHYDTTDGSLAVGIDRTAIPGDVDIPAYDLGYLLRKLNQNGYVELRTHGNTHDSWTCAYEHHADDGETQGFEYANTPDDAAAKLAIELFKRGKLTKEQ